MKKILALMLVIILVLCSNIVCFAEEAAASETELFAIIYNGETYTELSLAEAIEKDLLLDGSSFENGFLHYSNIISIDAKIVPGKILTPEEAVNESSEFAILITSVVNTSEKYFIRFYKEGYTSEISNEELFQGIEGIEINIETLDISDKTFNYESEVYQYAELNLEFCDDDGNYISSFYFMSDINCVIVLDNEYNGIIYYPKGAESIGLMIFSDMETKVAFSIPNEYAQHFVALLLPDGEVITPEANEINLLNAEDLTPYDGKDIVLLFSSDNNGANYFVRLNVMVY